MSMQIVPMHTTTNESRSARLMTSTCHHTQEERGQPVAVPAGPAIPQPIARTHNTGGQRLSLPNSGLTVVDDDDDDHGDDDDDDE